jgi:hypothetical protein
MRLETKHTNGDEQDYVRGLPHAARSGDMHTVDVCKTVRDKRLQHAHGTPAHSSGSVQSRPARCIGQGGARPRLEELSNRRFACSLRRFNQR